MWCARYGHLDCAIILAQWNPESLQKRDNEGLNPVQIAVARGFVKCASELEKIQTSRAAPSFGQSLDSEDFSFSKSRIPLSHINTHGHYYSGVWSRCIAMELRLCTCIIIITTPSL